VAVADGYVVDAENHHISVSSQTGGDQPLNAAHTAQEIWRAVGSDFWVVVPVESATREGHRLEGTRLTVVNLSVRGQTRMSYGKQQNPSSAGGASTETALDAPKNIVPLALHDDANKSSKETEDSDTDENQGQPDSYEFSIRTPVTPPRWDDFDKELSAVFECLVQAMEDEDRPKILRFALLFAYYWYNFMPLARGSALCGYVFLLGSLLAGRMPIRNNIPCSYQVDWEAILESSPEAFIVSMTEWMAPPEAHDLARVCREDWPCAPADELPLVKQVLSTMRERLEALNGPEGPKI
jgi:hypothetical protein